MFKLLWCNKVRSGKQRKRNKNWKFEIFGEIEFGGFLKFQFNNLAAFW
jgi:hypothetical protein